MPTELNIRIAKCLREAGNPVIRSFDPPETRIPWPGQPRSFWPCADISGNLRNGDRFIVEIDEHADPVRSLIKYWPLLHFVHGGEFRYPPICFVEISSRDSTFGTGFQALCRFVGKRLEATYGRRFRFRHLPLKEVLPEQLSRETLSFFETVCAGS